MNSIAVYGIILVILFLLELGYFRIADRFNIIDRPNERSSHSSVVLRGGGIVFLLGVWVWCAFFGFRYPCFLAALTLVAAVSFADDVRSLPDWMRLVAQFAAMGLMFCELDMMHWGLWWVVALALTVCVGATNVINFMDGINGITAGYGVAVMLPLLLVSRRLGFIEESFITVALLSLLVFAFFNFRGRGKARCFAGDVGSIGLAFIMLFTLGRLIMLTGDVTWLVFLLVYGVDGCLTICHRILLRENLGQAHRKHVYQLMANELRMPHPLVALIYMVLQLAVSLGFICFCPDTPAAHWCYLLAAFAVFSIAYVLFKKKYYHLHEEYLASLGH
ncbi:MAG: glycosyltransferase family 4 protein [Bacteroidales bacterium]|nr:glycosyltransferase family 4 protein [Bacteroidales bacterium]